MAHGVRMAGESNQQKALINFSVLVFANFMTADQLARSTKHILDRHRVNSLSYFDRPYLFLMKIPYL